MSVATKVSIIGTAGRGADGRKLSKDLHYRTVEKTKEVISDIWKLKLSDIHLVSGGAAWAGKLSLKCLTQDNLKYSLTPPRGCHLHDRVPLGIVSCPAPSLEEERSGDTQGFL